MLEPVIGAGFSTALAPPNTGAEWRIALEVAGVLVTLVGHDAGAVVRLKSAFSDHLVAWETPSALTATVNMVELGGGETRSLSGVGVEGDRIRIDLLGLFATFDLATRRGGLCVHDMVTKDGPTLELSAATFLRTVIGAKITRQGGTVLHASSVVRDGMAHVFIGPPGIGKSTAAASSRSIGYRTLGDDRTILTLEDDRVMAHGVPFFNLTRPGDVMRGAFPVAGIHYLRQDRHDFLEPVSAAVGAVRLTEQAPLAINCHQFMDATVEACARIARLVPVHILHLRKGPSFWEVL